MPPFISLSLIKHFCLYILYIFWYCFKIVLCIFFILGFVCILIRANSYGVYIVLIISHLFKTSKFVLIKNENNSQQDGKLSAQRETAVAAVAAVAAAAEAVTAVKEIPVQNGGGSDETGILGFIYLMWKYKKFVLLIQIAIMLVIFFQMLNPYIFGGAVVSLLVVFAVCLYKIIKTNHLYVINNNNDENLNDKLTGAHSIAYIPLESYTMCETKNNDKNANSVSLRIAGLNTAKRLATAMVNTKFDENEDEASVYKKIHNIIIHGNLNKNDAPAFAETITKALSDRKT